MPSTPPTLSPLPTAEWDASLKRVVEDMKGAPINVHKLMAHNPALLQAWWSFRNHATNGGALGPRLGELVILRVGVQLSAWYEWGSHVDRSLRSGLTLDEINRVLLREIGPAWSPEEAALLTAVDELIETHALSGATRAILAEHFTAPQVLDIIAIQGMYLILGCMIRSWGLELDPDVQRRIEGHATREGFQSAAAQFHGAPVEDGSKP